MRALYVPVRLVAAVVAAAATAGCMSVGDDAGRPGPSHSAERRADGAPDGGAVVGGSGIGSYGGKGGKHGKGGKRPVKPGESASGDAPASASPDAGPSVDVTEKGGGPSEGSAPPGDEPSPAGTSAEPTPEPPSASPSSAPPDPGTPEPSSSAHEQPVTQLIQREPAPEAGSPV
ncbi:hypothetical protein ABZ871_31290 [Streptomyces populi]